MKTITLNGQSREVTKKSALKAMRKEGNIPCVLYGNGVENVIFFVTEKEIRTITHTPNSYIINLNISGKEYLSIFHTAQFHPVTDNTLHVDFFAIDVNKPLAIDIPIVISGNSEGVKQGGKLMITNRKLKVSAPIDTLPDSLPIDITELQLGKTVVAGDLSFEGVNIVSPKSTIICSVKMTRAAIGAAAAAAAAEKRD